MYVWNALYMYVVGWGKERGYWYEGRPGSDVDVDYIPGSCWLDWIGLGMGWVCDGAKVKHEDQFGMWVV